MSKDLIPVSIAYAVTIFGAALTLYVCQSGFLLNALWADLVGTVIIFAFGRYYKNSSFYDAYWSVIPPLLAVYWLVFHVSPDVDATRQAMVLILVWLWGIRLTANWATYWEGLTHEDWRYAPIREKAGKHKAIADFLAIHLFPTLIVFFACLPIFAAVSVGDNALNWLDWIAFIVVSGAILIETIADLQLHAFLPNRKEGEIMQTGLWKYSRHPNYFGEMSFWIGLMLFGLAAYPEGWWWIMPGGVAMTAMFYFVSIPLIDDRSKENRPGYDEHMKKVSAIIPWFPAER